MTNNSQTFEDFWPVCARKIDRAMCQMLFDGITSLDGITVTMRDTEGNTYRPHLSASAAEVIEGMKAYRYEKRDDDLKYIKHPATWLRHGCWQDHDDRAEMAAKWDEMMDAAGKAPVEYEYVKTERGMRRVKKQPLRLVG